ncbi:MAG: ATP cone domain-containing protein [Clostridium sp.]
MLVIKRSGKKQEFNPDKLVSAIQNASEDCNEPLNSSDLEVLVKGILRKIKSLNIEEITSEEIYDTIIVELTKSRFYNLAKVYNEGALNRRR